MMRGCGYIAFKYQGMLNQNLTVSARKYKLAHGWIYLQENDSKPILKSTQTVLTDHRIGENWGRAETEGTEERGEMLDLLPCLLLSD